MVNCSRNCMNVAMLFVHSQHSLTFVNNIWRQDIWNVYVIYLDIKWKQSYHFINFIHLNILILCSDLYLLYSVFFKMNNFNITECNSISWIGYSLSLLVPMHWTLVLLQPTLNGSLEIPGWQARRSLVWGLSRYPRSWVNDWFCNHIIWPVSSYFEPL